jgi:hypothetical protein
VRGEELFDPSVGKRPLDPGSEAVIGRQSVQDPQFLVPFDQGARRRSVHPDQQGRRRSRSLTRPRLERLETGNLGGEHGRHGRLGSLIGRVERAEKDGVRQSSRDLEEVYVVLLDRRRGPHGKALSAVVRSSASFSD